MWSKIIFEALKERTNQSENKHNSINERIKVRDALRGGGEEASCCGSYRSEYSLDRGESENEVVKA